MSRFGERYLKSCQERRPGESPEQFVLYQELDPTGWGNKLAALNSAFLLALVTERVLLIDFPLLHQAFNPPVGLHWTFSERRKHFHHGITTHYLDPCHRAQEMLLLATADLKQAFPQTILIHTQGNAFDEAIATNPHCSEILHQRLRDPQSRRSRIGQVTSFLLSNPKQDFLRSVESRLTKYGSTRDRTTVAVQFRTFYDVGSPHLKHLEFFIKEVKAILQSDALQAKHNGKVLQFLVTSDDLDVTRRLAKELEPYGEVVFDPSPIVHSGRATKYWRYLGILDRLQNLIPQRRGHRTRPPSNVNWSARLRKRFRHLPSSVLVDWYLLGECQVLLSNLTTYAAFAAARVEDQPLVYKICGESNFSGLVTEEEYNKCIG